MKTVLAIDGGGVRGMLPAMILAEIEDRTGRPTHELFDVIAGTSTGAFIAALAARKSGQVTPLSAPQIVDLYRREAKRYFKRRFGSLRGWFGPLYQARSVEDVLREQLQDAVLSDTATSLIIPVYALRDGIPRVHYFNTLSAKQFSTDNHLLWQIVRGATAAPSLFAPFTVESTGGSLETPVIDGGVYANNPAMLGWLHAHQTLSSIFRGKKKGEYFPLNEQFDTCANTLADTVVVSIGTGFANRPVDAGKARRWGKLGWMLPILGVISEGQSDQATAELEIADDVAMLHYFERLQPLLDEKIGPGDVRKMPDLEQAAATFIENDKHGKKRIDEICQKLLAAKP